MPSFHRSRKSYASKHFIFSMGNSRKRNRDLRGESGNAESLEYGLRPRNRGEDDGVPGNGRLPAGCSFFVVESEKFNKSPKKRMIDISSERSIKLDGRSATLEVAGTINTNEPMKKRVTEADQNEQQYGDFRVCKPSPLLNSMAFECSKVLCLGQFRVGDIVWARSDRIKDFPAWPAKVIEPSQDAPESVDSVWVPGRRCVRFFRMKNSWDCAYAWVKEEMMFPFSESLEELAYEGRKLLESTSKHLRREFVEAIEEAFVAEFSSEYRVMQDQDTHQGEETTCISCSQKFTASKLVQSVKVKQLSNSSKNGAVICPRCCKLYEYNQYCGICKKVCMTPTLKKRWVQCKKCKIWVHADCDNISTEQLQDHIEYSCPQCTLKQPTLETVLKEKNNTPFILPERITVVCNGKEADYVTNSHLIFCKCSECRKGKSMSLSGWEKHVGSKMKKWKQSVRVRDSNQYLINWLNKAYEDGARGLGFFSSEGQMPLSTWERELTRLLLEPYEPIKEIWTAERCAVCREIEDWAHDKIIVCNGCDIGVHQSCYGASKSLDNWICTACQRAETETWPQCCCLCPVMGGALKPTTTSGFWVHVICACFSNKVTFGNDKTLEPVDGILKIDPASFRKSCVICNKVHGSCIKCLKCTTFYHPTCALIKGYHMEMVYWEKKKKNVCSYISYCASHKVPDPNVGIIIPELKSIGKPNKNEAPAVIQSEDSPDVSSASNDDNNLQEDCLSKIDEPYASKCSVYNPLREKCGLGTIIHRPMGYSHHPREVIDNRLKPEQIVDPPQFFSYKERLFYNQKNEKHRFCFGKSGLHGYGLFAMKHIGRGDMVIEYRGDIVRNSVANVREKRYHSQGKHSTYFFKIDEDTVIDATNLGNTARLINHSCEPNCFSRILAVDGVENRIAFFANKDIEAGEEITYDYRLSKGGFKLHCRCGAATCRKVI